MNELNSEQMKEINGGDGWDCAAMVGGFVAAGIAAVFAPPAGAALAAAIFGGALSFGGAVISSRSC